jgi:hypothetical protein
MYTKRTLRLASSKSNAKSIGNPPAAGPATPVRLELFTFWYPAKIAWYTYKGGIRG